MKNENRKNHRFILQGQQYMIKLLPMILKVQIHTLDNEVEIELKQYQDLYRLLIIKSKSGFDKDSGTVWHGESRNQEAINTMSNLIVQCYRSPHKPGYISILDGMHVSIHYIHEETELKFSFKEFEEGSNEVLLLRTLIAFCKPLAHDETFNHYAASIERYFK
jgi:hypothetical protein